MPISRRGLLAGLPLLLAGCASTYNEQQNYAAVPEEEFPLHRVPIDKIKPELRRQQVAFSGNYAPGTVVVDTPARRAYYVLGGGQAIRYGVGVGRAGMALSGNAYVGRKAEWPSWTPTPAMQRREERYRKLAGGLPGGPNNPLGARAMYLYRNGNDTMFRLHGTNQPESIGHAMSSGCIRMMNHDVIDLYNRVQVGAKVVVIQA
ncbi:MULTISPECIES: L,D-transpeptidase [Rhizobiaceae]|jgi:lipoprotein-anchoring transpeptidase ErfK/SrfK|uniref:Lipoprotein-anchoring transpeptidase ErfK/SrfK n=1 Tax=Aliirhizobium cellulosilyticum TaxID=393664 RepID=A0A7W6Y1N2_9HYPH|nr:MULTISPECIES: L,D-transpeptidase [Rhizobium/Agrobacterium group]MBB4348121.1 lipoprotein-anchoring transpeptidase ErfK/SrfK [Rhizobium cellulosilyticum]MBB4411358.1 lipoprotein-anchoring transpeptidase ErfK/SrfK [Rhizobium cellulosilyticum]MBB4446047.1 lipoprotein-anchoring transpeptidase ErfK/SrfK [Rhizobium cellulosilyticum]MBO0142523.1 L,D-transpeptidase [Agrobacterium sp. Ap1]